MQRMHMNWRPATREPTSRPQPAPVCNRKLPPAPSPRRDPQPLRDSKTANSKAAPAPAIPPTPDVELGELEYGLASGATAQASHLSGPPEAPGSDLAAGGDSEYRKRIEQLSDKNPNLRHRDWKIPKYQTERRHEVPSSLKVLQFTVATRPAVPSQGFEATAGGSPPSPASSSVPGSSLAPGELFDVINKPGLAILREHLKRPAQAADGETVQGHLYILQGLDPEYVEVLGKHPLRFPPPP